MLASLTEALRAEGTLQSEGSFTLDLLKRSRSLWHLQRREPNLWLFKLAQAAVGSGASQISIDTENQRIRVRFSPFQLDLSALKSGIEGADPGCGRGESHLAVALVLALGVPGGGLEVTMTGPDGGLRLSRSQGQTRLESSPGGSWEVLLDLQTPPQAWWKVWARASEARRTEMSLRGRLACCCIPVLWNGEDLADGQLQQLVGLPHSGSHRDPFETVAVGFHWLAQAPQFCVDGGFRLCPQYVQAVSYHLDRGTRRRAEGAARSLAVLSDWTRSQARLQEHTDGNAGKLTRDPKGHSLSLTGDENFRLSAGWRCATLLLLPLAPARNGGILPILDGLALDPIPVPGALAGAWAVLDVPHGKVDAGQLQLIREEGVWPGTLQDLQRRWDELSEQARALVAVSPDLERAGLTAHQQHQWRDYFRALRC